MWACMDTTSKGHAPVRNDFSAFSLYWLAWMFLGSFIALNLFVGAIVDNFNAIKAESDGSAALSHSLAAAVVALLAA